MNESIRVEKGLKQRKKGFKIYLYILKPFSFEWIGFIRSKNFAKKLQWKIESVKKIMLKYQMENVM